MTNFPDFPANSPVWSRRTKRIVGITLLFFVLFTAYHIGYTWLPLIFACLLAYLLYPLMRYMELVVGFIRSESLRRDVAIVLTLFWVMGIVSLVGTMAVVPMIAEARTLGAEIPRLWEETQDIAVDVFDMPIQLELDDRDLIQQAFSGFLTPLLTVFRYVIDAGVMLAFTGVMTVYLLKSGDRFIEQFYQIVPIPYREEAQFMLHELGKIWHSYFRGQLILCMVVGVLTYGGAVVLGLPHPLILGILAGILEVLPSIGPTLAAVPAVLFALTTPSQTLPLDGVIYAGVVVVMYMGLQALENAFLVPRIMGGSLKLHPFVVIVAVLFGAKLVGILGVILAAPTTATLWLLFLYIGSKLSDDNWFMKVGWGRAILANPPTTALAGHKPALQEGAFPSEIDLSKGEKV